VCEAPARPAGMRRRILVLLESNRDGNGSSSCNALISELRHHAGGLVVEIVTVERPSPGIVGVESDPDTAHRHDQNSVADGALHRPAVDRDHLESMAMQMHRMRQIERLTRSISIRCPLSSMSGVTCGQY